MAMIRIIPLDSSSAEPDVFHVERTSEEGSPARNNTPAVFNSTELSGAMARETIIFSSVTSPEPHFVTIESKTKESTIPYEFGNQHSIVPFSLNYLNLPPNPINVLTTMAVIQLDKQCSLKTLELSNPFPIFTPQ